MAPVTTGAMNHTTSLLTLTELAVALRVPENWLEAEAEAGRIPCLRAGKRYRFALAAVEAALVHRAASGDAMTAPAGSPEWRAAMVARLA
jgi:excisionase family DNA binding protein